MKNTSTSHFIIVFILIILIVPSFAQTTDTQEEHYFYFLSKKKSEVIMVGEMLSISNVIADTVFCYAATSELKQFETLGISYTLLPHPGIQPEAVMWDGSAKTRGQWDTYPTYEGYLQMMDDFATTYPNLCSLVCFDTLSSGRELLAININNGISTASDVRPRVLYTSTMHGDETVGYVLMLHLIDSLLTGYGNDPVATFLVDSLNIWINPNANPDGTYWAGNHTVSGSRRYNSNFVDLNRNYPDPENGPHPDGKTWQEETIAFMNLADEIGFDISVNIHGGAEVCNYPWDTWSPITADDLWWQLVCNEYADTAQYFSPPGYMDDFGTGVINGYDWYTTNGSRQDYMNWFQQCREFTLELSRTKNPASSQLPAFWEYNHRSLFNYLKQASYGVHGFVTDSVTGQPVKAKVFIAGHDIDSSWVFSDHANGDFHRYLKAGTYPVTFSAPGYISKTVIVTVTDAEKQFVDVQLLPQSLVQTIIFPEGWTGFSTYLIPENDSTEVIFSPLADTLIIIKYFTRVFWPPYSNSLPVISPFEGYIVKMKNETTISFTGYLPGTSTIELYEGWNRIPVMSVDSISSATLFSPVLDKIIIVKSFNGDQIYWPESGINSMEYLYSGRSYLIKVDEDCSITY